MCRWALTYPYPYLPSSSLGRSSRRVLPQLRHPLHRQAASSLLLSSDMERHESSQGSLSLFLFLLPLRLFSLFVDAPKCILLPGHTRTLIRSGVLSRPTLQKMGADTSSFLPFSVRSFATTSLLTPVPKTWRYGRRQSGRDAIRTRVRPDTCSY